MKLKVKQKDLFKLPKKYYLAHCISSDFGMSGGIVLLFNKYFDMKNILQSNYEKTWNDEGYCIKEGRVYNLITKELVGEQPTYEHLFDALYQMAHDVQTRGIKKVAMPLIGCGIDGLVWSEVEPIIKEAFHGVDCKILVCYLERDKHLLEL